MDPRCTKAVDAVAGAGNPPAAGDEVTQRFDDRRAPRDRPGAQVVAVGEAARQDDAVEVVEIPVPVPDVLHRLVEHFGDHIVEGAVAPPARGDDYAETPRTIILPG